MILEGEIGISFAGPYFFGLIHLCDTTNGRLSRTMYFLTKYLTILNPVLDLPTWHARRSVSSRCDVYKFWAFWLRLRRQLAAFAVHTLSQHQFSQTVSRLALAPKSLGVALRPTRLLTSWKTWRIWGRHSSWRLLAQSMWKVRSKAIRSTKQSRVIASTISTRAMSRSTTSHCISWPCKLSLGCKAKVLLQSRCKFSFWWHLTSLATKI